MNLFTKITTKLQGRTTSFLVAFFVSGHLMQAIHRLDATYIAFMGTIMSFVLGHSIKDDHAPDADKTGTP